MYLMSIPDSGLKPLTQPSFQALFKPTLRKYKEDNKTKASKFVRYENDQRISIIAQFYSPLNDTKMKSI